MNLMLLMPSGWDLLLKSRYYSGKKSDFSGSENNCSVTLSISVIQGDEICISSFNCISEHILILHFSRKKTRCAGEGGVYMRRIKRKF